MSQQKQTRLSYTREFLLRFEKDFSKPNLKILETMKPFINNTPSRQIRTPCKNILSATRLKSTLLSPSSQIKFGKSPTLQNKIIQLDSGPFRPEANNLEAFKVFIPKTPAPKTQTKVDVKEAPATQPAPSNKIQSRIPSKARAPLKPISLPLKESQTNNIPSSSLKHTKTSLINKENVCNDNQTKPRVLATVKTSNSDNSTVDRKLPVVVVSPCNDKSQLTLAKPPSQNRLAKNSLSPPVQKRVLTPKKNTPKDLTPLSQTTSTSASASVSPSTPEATKFSPGGTVLTPTTRSGRKLPSVLDDNRLKQRQKQIDYGYRTVGYLRYRLLVPKDKRQPEHPRTPRKTQPCSKRSWDGQLRKWRRELHRWDPDDLEAFQSLLESDFVAGLISSSEGLAEILAAIKERGFSLDPNDVDEINSHVTEQEIETKQQKPIEPEMERVARTLVF